MTKAQALALMTALEGAKMPAQAVLSFDAAGAESWTVALDTSHSYTGTQVSQLTAYCTQNGLSLTAQFSALGIT